MSNTIKGNVAVRNGIAKTIKAMRRMHGMTQKEFAEKIGVSANMVSLYECRKQIPSPKTVVRINEIFGVDISEAMRN